MKAFLSHSSKDVELVNRIYKALHRANIKPKIAEFEKIKKGQITAEEIGEWINESNLFILMLTSRVGEKSYTRNWVSFELGCAYGKHPSYREDRNIFVLEQFDQLEKFAIPYLDYYMLFDPDANAHWEMIEGLLSKEEEYND